MADSQSADSGEWIGPAVEQYVRSAAQGVAYFDCPDTLRPDSSRWFIFTRSKDGILVDEQTFDRLQQSFRYVLPVRIAISVLIVGAGWVRYKSFGFLSREPQDGLAIVAILAACLAVIFVPPLLCALWVRRILGCCGRVQLPPEFTEMVTKIERRRNVIAGAGRLLGMLGGRTVEGLAGKVAEKVTEEVIERIAETAADADADRHRNRLLDERRKRTE
jgi:hypothetical protein